MEFDSREFVKVKPIDEHNGAVLGFSTNGENDDRQPIGSIMGDADILQDLDGIIQTKQDGDLEEQSSCGCGTGCSCSGATCSCSSKNGSDVFKIDHLFEDVGDSFFELFDVIDNAFSSKGSARFDQDSMQEFAKLAEQALENLFDSLADRSRR